MGSSIIMDDAEIGEEEIVHIFLPYKLPQQETATNDLHRNLVSLMQSALQTCSKYQNFFPISKTRKSFQTWTQFQYIKDSALSSRIRDSIINLQEGDLIPLYLPEQNAGIFFSMDKLSDTTVEPYLVMSTFQASCKSDAVMSTQGDLLVNFPEQSVQIPINSTLVQSQEIGNVLELLINTSFDMAMPKSTKARKTVVETRDVADPMFATDWLTHLLCDENSKSDHGFPQICKKIRDDVILGDNVGIPFRRSGLWTVIKVALQIGLIRELGRDDGTFAYKCVMICAMNRALEMFHEIHIQSNSFSRYDTDITVQMMRKIARRLDKLKHMKKSHAQLTEGTIDWIENNVTDLLYHVNEKLQKLWLSTSTIDETAHGSGRISVSNPEKEAMLEQICPDVKQEIQIRQVMKSENATNKVSATPPIPNCPTRSTSNKFPEVNPISTYHEADFELIEIENWVKLFLDSFRDSRYCGQIKSLVMSYSRKAMTHYKDDPIGNSRLILTVLKCIQILDEIVTNKYPLFRNHKSGIYLGFMERLILPRKCDMEFAFTLQKYFVSRDSSLSSQDPSLVSEEIPTEQSFAVRFAKQSDEMKNLRVEILQTIEKETEQKLQEVARVREECKDLRYRISSKSCEYQYNKYTESTEHATYCSKCSLKRTLDAKLVSVRPYEKRLPCSETMQFAVVFEIKIPEEISILRDMLYFFKVDILSNLWLDTKVHVNWVDSSFVKEYKNSASTHTNLKLGSTTKPSAVTHWNRNRVISVDQHESCFILNNGLNFIYHGESHLGKVIPLEIRCTFPISNSTSNYKGMQWAIDWTNHTPNSVLARQCECPPTLSIKEFLQFGYLRAGNKIQYRNIVLALTNDSLSWNAEEVFILLCQAQFQFEKSNNSTSWVTEAHEDLQDAIFATKLLKIVEDKVDSNEKKWSDPYMLCCFVTIVGRVLEIGNVQKVASNLLIKCRKIAVDWMFKLQDLIGKAYAAPESEKNALKLKLILSALAVSLSFHVSPNHVGFVMSTSDDLLNWMLAISIVYNEVFWNFEGRIKVLGITSLQRTLLRLSISTGLLLEPAINQMEIENRNHAFNSFATHSWKVSPSFPEGWTRCSKVQIFECPRVMNSNGSAHQTFVDIIFGRFLVDGLPVGRVPEDIVRSPIYQRVFQKAEFSVQPNMSHGVMVFSTTTKYKNCTYRFYQQQGKMIIEELFEKDGRIVTLDLIPHSLLENDFPFSFSRNFSHWWNPETNIISFRPKQFDLSNFYEIQYEWNLDQNRLQEIETSRKLISMHSGVFAKLCVHLMWIEPLGHIHSWITKDGTIEVELTQLGLKFCWSEVNNQLLSREFPGMHVDPYQNIGTLVGLVNKLVLTESRIAIHVQPARKVIVPHGYLTISSGVEGTGHQHVTVDLDRLRSPRYFVYDLEYHRKFLEAVKSQSAWLYLAALHGATSSPLTDEFTGVTGTEMAFQIMKSARAWSCQPYDEECRTTLTMISSFSPIRKFYPNHLRCQQKIIWPAGLPSICAHEGYSDIVDRLVENSNKLRKLFPGMSDPDTSQLEETEKFLSRRHYWRQSALDNPLTYIPALDNCRPLPERHERKSILWNRNEINKNVRELSYLCGQWKSFFGSTVQIVRGLLMSCEELKGKIRNIEKIKTESFVTTLEELIPLRNSWIDFYRLAISIGKNEAYRPWWAVLLTSLVFMGADMDQLRILHCIAVHWENFQNLQPPEIDRYKEPSSKFSIKEIKDILNSKSIPFDGNIYNTLREKEEARRHYNSTCESEVSQIALLVQNQCTPKMVCRIHLGMYGITKIKQEDAQIEINKLIKKWFESSKLDEFLEQFESTFKTCFQKNKKPTFAELEKLSNIYDPINLRPNFDLPAIIQNLASIELDTKTEEAIYMQNSDEKAVVVDYDAKHFETVEGFLECLEIVRIRSHTIWNKLTSCMSGFSGSSFGVNSLISSGIFPRLVPSTLLPIILWKTGTDINSQTLQKIQSLVGAVCVYWTLENKMLRCTRFMMAGSSMELALLREKETEGLKSWCPNRNPEWLLLELELNMTIRPIQVKVARAMLTPESKSNSVLQLNMGEGKTSIIVPMLAVSIADGSQLCRVTVIKSIFETNVNWLKHTLGGLLNRRVYIVPCGRDVDFDIPLTSSMECAYAECLQKKGVVVTLPEFRLSFQLKGYEIARKGNAPLATALIRLQTWLDKCSRDILDESDEILSVKYQLIYTVGSQVPIGGGSLRWEIAQKLLKQLPAVMLELKQQYGDDAIEFFKEDREDGSVFPSCRLLQSDVYQDLIDKLANNFIDRNVVGFGELKPHELSLIKKFLTNNKVTPEDIDDAMNIPCIQGSEKKTAIILILAGYLRFGVLESALSKRWRVNFGVNPKGHRKMAVPFKAKDVASERTEFGHPDMAIVLTQISYYNSGLNDKQLMECFAFFRKNIHMNPTSEYARWIENVPSHKIEKSVKHYSGVNLEDHEQRTRHLFPILRKSTAMIDFWLNTFVYPMESKQFEGKMTCTAWDLVSENKLKITTGFSGTNDSKNLLPALISQNDLPELQTTNQDLEAILRSPEMMYRHFSSETTSIGILEELKKEGIKVLLDCGALMLQLDNDQVAVKWMEIDLNLEAVVFFNKDNVLSVKDRERFCNCPFELSPYRERLDVCAIYLDDEHTRGTDLKFPQGSRACITLGSCLTRDKMAQACMRMRMLGRGHFVTFWASNEVHSKIKLQAKLLTIGGDQVLDWVKRNSKQFEEDGMIYWTNSAVNYCKKRGAEIIFNDAGIQTEESFRRFGELCSESEIVELMHMYCHARNQSIFSCIFPKWFKVARTALIKDLVAFKKNKQLNESFQNIETKCGQRIQDIIPTKLHFSQLLDEEQEKELEKEVEQESERQLPGRAEACTHTVSKGLMMALFSGEIKLQEKTEIFRIAEVFSCTTVKDKLQAECWGEFVLCTKDFSLTVKRESELDTLTDFLRPVNWVVKLLNASQQPMLVVISPFEANALISQFRKGEFKGTLHLFSPRTLPSHDILIDNPRLTLPSSNDPSDQTPWVQLLPPLFLCGGNLFFKTTDEGEAFANWLGIIPRPREEHLQRYFEQGLISPKNGFVEPQNRNFEQCPISGSAFYSDPETLVADIARIRHQSTFPADAHVAMIVANGMKAVPLLRQEQ